MGITIYLAAFFAFAHRRFCAAAILARASGDSEGRYQRGRGSVDDYLEQTAIANPHVTIHYADPDSRETTFSRSTTQLPREPVEIKPRPPAVYRGNPFLIEVGLAHGGASSTQKVTLDALTSYPEIMKKLRLGLQTVGRKLAVYLNRRKQVRQEHERREFFLRYLGEVTHAVATIKDYGDRPREDLYTRLVNVAKRKTSVADTQLNEEGKRHEKAVEELGENVLIVDSEGAPGRPHRLNQLRKTDA